MRRLKADWVTARASAEREKLRVSARLRKSSIHLSSIAGVRVGGAGVTLAPRHSMGSGRARQPHAP